MIKTKTMPPENYWYSSSEGNYRYEYDIKDGSYRRMTAEEQVKKIQLDRLLLALSYILDYDTTY
jgi:hypothetical protein